MSDRRLKPVEQVLAMDAALSDVRSARSELASAEAVTSELFEQLRPIEDAYEAAGAERAKLQTELELATASAQDTVFNGIADKNEVALHGDAAIEYTESLFTIAGKSWEETARGIDALSKILLPAAGIVVPSVVLGPHKAIVGLHSDRQHVSTSVSITNPAENEFGLQYTAPVGGTHFISGRFNDWKARGVAGTDSIVGPSKQFTATQDPEETEYVLRNAAERSSGRYVHVAIGVEAVGAALMVHTESAATGSSSLDAVRFALTKAVGQQVGPKINVPNLTKDRDQKLLSTIRNNTSAKQLDMVPALLHGSLLGLDANGRDKGVRAVLGQALNLNALAGGDYINGEPGRTAYLAALQTEDADKAIKTAAYTITHQALRDNSCSDVSGERVKLAIGVSNSTLQLLAYKMLRHSTLGMASLSFSKEARALKKMIKSTRG